MGPRRIEIYNRLFSQLYTKQELSDKFKVGIKTIENTIKLSDDIVYSKKLGCYHFKNLLPNYVSYHNYFMLFQDSLSNPILKKDFINITSQLSANLNEIMIDTNKLSDLSKKIIQANIAINHNCVLKVEYTGNSKPKEEKYIQPKQIFTDGSIYYMSIVYDKRNKKDIGKERQLAFNGVESLEPVEYLKDVTFKVESENNAFGNYKNAKKINLKLHDSASNFFKREGFFENNNFKFLSELSNNEIKIEMRYNYKLEVIKLVQQWLPQITIDDDSQEALEIIDDIKTNYQQFISIL